MPPWTDVQADVDVVCKLHQRLSDCYDTSTIDVVLVGIFHQVGCAYTSPSAGADMHSFWKRFKRQFPGRAHALTGRWGAGV